VNKSEKLARELASLRLQYSDSDFDAAMRILASGELFSRAIEAAEHARRQRVVKRKPKTEKISYGAEVATTSLFRKLEVDFGVRMLAERILNRELLKSGSALRAFAEIVDVRLPKKLPSRLAVADRICTQIISLPPEQRVHVIKQAESMDKEVSSLQLWSDVIVQQADKST
jgi:hypothetical protein